MKAERCKHVARWLSGGLLVVAAAASPPALAQASPPAGIASVPKLPAPPAPEAPTASQTRPSTPAEDLDPTPALPAKRAPAPATSRAGGFVVFPSIVLGQSPPEARPALDNQVAQELRALGVAIAQPPSAPGAGADLTPRECSEQLPCIKAWAQSVNARYAVVPRMGPLGVAYVLSLSVVDATSDEAPEVVTAEAPSTELVLLDVPWLVETALADVLSLRFGDLEVVVAQPNATITLDGRVLGKSPLPAQRVRAGEHRLRVGKEGYFDYETAVIVPEKQSHVRKVLLTRLDSVNFIPWGMYVAAPLWMATAVAIALPIAAAGGAADFLYSVSPTTKRTVGIEDAVGPALYVTAAAVVGVGVATNPIWWWDRDPPPDRAVMIVPEGDDWEVSNALEE